MKARPILFSAPMVQALVDGRKVQTRRVVKPQPAHSCRYTMNGSGNAALHHVERSESGYFVPVPVGPRFRDHRLACPHGQRGDLLWVREPWRVIKDYDGFDSENIMVASGGDMVGCVDFTTTSSNPDWVGRRRHARFMPRWASRLTLEITDVRVERLQGISEADAKAEGCFFTDYGRRCFHFGQGDVATCPAPEAHHPQNPGWMWGRTTSHEQCLYSAWLAYGNLWNTINGPGSWDANPWVWVVEFKVHCCNVDALLKARAA